MRIYSSPNFCRADQRSLGAFRGENLKLFTEALDAFNTRLGLHAFRFFFIYDLLCVRQSINNVLARQNRLLAYITNRYSVPY